MQRSGREERVGTYSPAPQTRGVALRVGLTTDSQYPTQLLHAGASTALQGVVNHPWEGRACRPTVGSWKDSAEQWLFTSGVLGNKLPLCFQAVQLEEGLGTLTYSPMRSSDKITRGRARWHSS